MNKKDTFIRIATLSGALAVVAGAFGAHWLGEHLEARYLDTFNTGVRYHLIHSVVLLVLSLQLKEGKTEFLNPVRLILTGIIFFSFSLYFLAISSMGNTTLSWLGAITPIGGVAFIAGWIVTGIAATKKAG